jgi:hypothetical protein
MPFFGSLAAFSVRVVAGPPVVNPLTNTGSNDVFVVKYNSSGTPVWARRIGGTLSDLGNSVSVDSSGNVIVTGSYASATLNIYAADGTTVSFTLNRVGGAGTRDGFVVKYNSSGTALWARRIGGVDTDQPQSVTVDSSGNIIVAGYYADATLNIYAANGTTILFTLTNIGGVDGFVVKYDSSGTPLWARKLGGTNSGDEPYTVCVDSSGNIIVGGTYSSNPLNIYAANGTTVSFTLPNALNGAEAFVVKYDSSGTPVWARRLAGTANNNYTQSVSTDSSGNIIVVGYYSFSQLNIYAADGTTVSFTLANTGGSNDGFVVKYNSSGTPVWTRRLGGTGDDRALSVSIDSSGNVIVGGTYYSAPLNIYAANGTTVSFTLANTGVAEPFLLKYDSSGTPVWARRLGGAGADNGLSVSTDSSGNIIMAGYYASNPLNIYAANGSTVSFTLANDGSLGRNDVFVVKYDSSGTPLWARRMTGTLIDFGNSVSTDSSGNIVVAGYYASNPLSFS